MDNQLIFTPSSILALLTQIEELKDADIEIKEYDDSVEVIINDQSYTIDFSDSAVIEIEDEDLQDVIDVDDEGYEEVDNIEEAVEGGIIKELAKTLMIGGLVRLTSNAIKNS